uniref:Uncharacterized protein n=1 Tax=Haptolina ericina TaxID=156174 RepID=A0A7S3BPT9_9EUKA
MTRLKPRNTQGTAVGDVSIARERRVHFAIYFPVEANVQPVHMFFSRFAAGDKVLSAACREGGLSLDRGRLVGSPERLNLFTMDGDLLRVDLELDAHLGSTLQPSSVLILEKGNRVPDYRLDEIRQSVSQREQGGCGIQ